MSLGSRFAIGMRLFPLYCVRRLIVPTKSIIVSVKPITISSVKNYSKESKAEDLMANSDKIVTYEYVVDAISKADKTLIDVREVDEVKETGQIPTSINIPLSSLSQSFSLSDKAFEETFNKSKPTESSEIIFYCLSGKRSGMALDFALKNGYQKLDNQITIKCTIQYKASAIAVSIIFKFEKLPRKLVGMGTETK